MSACWCAGQHMASSHTTILHVVGPMSSTSCCGRVRAAFVEGKKHVIGKAYKLLFSLLFPLCLIPLLSLLSLQLLYSSSNGPACCSLDTGSDTKGRAHDTERAHAVSVCALEQGSTHQRKALVSGTFPCTFGTALVTCLIKNAGYIAVDPRTV